MDKKNPNEEETVRFTPEEMKELQEKLKQLEKENNKKA